MGRSNTGICRGCGAEMRWALTDKGKGIPLDPEPVADGNLVLDSEAADGRPVVRYVRKGEDTGILPRYVAHFATCPEAKEFRKK